MIFWSRVNLQRIHLSEECGHELKGQRGLQGHDHDDDDGNDDDDDNDNDDDDEGDDLPV